MILEASANSTQLINSALTRHELADLLVAYLEQIQVKYVFGVPGGAIEPLFNALARSKRKGGVRAVVARHETGAAFMAAGYAKNSGHLGVCCSTTGPGATNLITGVSSAHQNGVPILVITPQTVLSNFGRGALQESTCTGINTVGMFEFCTNYNTLISHIDQFEHKLCAAITNAIQTSSPSHISIPLDIQRSRITIDKPSYDLRELLNKPSLIDNFAVEKLLSRLTANKNNVFVIGDGCSEAMGSILNIAFLLSAPIVTTPHGKGLISPYHPLYRGVIGFAGHETANQTLSDPTVDNIIAIGTALSEWASNGWDKNTLINEKLIHIDANQNHFMHSPMAILHVRGNIKEIFNHIFEHVFNAHGIQSEYDRSQLRRSASDIINNSTIKLKRHFQLDEEKKFDDGSSPIKPQRLMRDLPRIFPPNTRYLADPGNSLTWSIHYLHPYDRRIAGRNEVTGGLFQSSLEFASMGWSIGAAIGVAMASPELPVVCIVGDGSLLMSGQEITVAIQENLTVIFAVLNDSALGMVKHGQRLAKAEQTAFELPDIDYFTYAKSMGVTAYTIRSPQDLVKLDIKKICSQPAPTLLDIRIDGEEVPPMKARMKVLGTMQ